MRRPIRSSLWAVLGLVSALTVGGTASAASPVPFDAVVTDLIVLDPGVVRVVGDRVMSTDAVVTATVSGDIDGTLTYSTNEVIDASSGDYVAQHGTFALVTDTVTWSGVFRVVYSPAGQNDRLSGRGTDGSTIEADIALGAPIVLTGSIVP